MARQHQPILVCFAVREERRFFSAPPEVRVPVEVLVTGMGAANARRAILEALDRAAFRFVLSCGFAGALRPGLAVGDLLCCVHEGAPTLDLCNAPGVRPASFHCAGRIATTAAEKSKLWSETGADAVEMESGVILQACQERAVPCAALRVISDTADEDLPLDFNRLMTPDLRLHYGKLVWALCKSPGTVPGLLRLQRQSQYAARRLGEALAELLRRQAALP